MKILLDTHIVLWFNTEDKRLSQKAWDILLDPKNEIYYSVINIWETEIKYLNKKESFPVSGKQLKEFSEKAGLQNLDLKPQHTLMLSTLHYSESAPKPHKDPFDRMLICQAKSEEMLLMTHDALLPYYNEPCVLWV